jgi:hypothetical protein
VGVRVGVSLRVGLFVAVGVTVEVGLCVEVSVTVGVSVRVGVSVGVALGVTVVQRPDRPGLAPPLHTAPSTIAHPTQLPSTGGPHVNDSHWQQSFLPGVGDTCVGAMGAPAHAADTGHTG